MTDYSTLDDDALQYEIAKRLGWTNLEWQNRWYEDPDSGSSQQRGLEGKMPDDWNIIVAPDWPRSVDAALTLPFPENREGYPDGKVLYIEIATSVQVWIGTVAIRKPPIVYAGSGYQPHAPINKRLARALSELWLTWMDTKEKETEK